MSDPGVYYTTTEIQSYLPTGWILLDDPADPSRKDAVWAARVIDGADTEWCLEVGGRDVDEHGRLGALQREVDRVYREALG